MQLALLEYGFLLPFWAPLSSKPSAHDLEGSLPSGPSDNRGGVVASSMIHVSANPLILLSPDPGSLWLVQC